MPSKILNAIFNGTKKAGVLEQTANGRIYFTYEPSWAPPVAQVNVQAEQSDIDELEINGSTVDE